MMKRFLLGLALAAMALPSASHAQSPLMETDTLAGAARAASARGDHEEALSIYVRAISRKPDDALILRSAGEEALAIGDNDAAFGFLGRAVTLAPRDAQARAGYGRALVQAMRPKDALTLFDQAVRLGMNEADIAADRGMVRDLLGESRRAQKDYRIGLAAYPGKGVLIERMGLSLAISGERDQAVALVRPVAQRTGSGNTWRTLAFIYALSGDVTSARRIALGNMPPSLADSYTPFFARIALLDDKDKAAAVFLGQLPQVRLARRDKDVPERVKMPDAKPSDIRSASVGYVPAASVARLADAKAEKEPQPKAEAAQAPDPCVALSGKRKTQCQANERSLQRRCAGAKSRKTAECKAYLAEREKRADDAPKPKGAEKQAVSRATGIKEQERGAAARQASPLDACEQLKGAKAVQCKADARMLEKRCGGARPQKTAECDAYAERYGGQANGAAARKDGKAADRKPEKGKARERFWVQVAGGRNRADLPKEWAKLKAKYSLLARRAPYVAEGRGTNRLVIGPFDSAADARDLVNKLSAAGLPTFPWTSEAGDDVVKMSAK